MENFDSEYWSGQGPGFIGDRDSNGDPIQLQFAGDIEAIEFSAQKTKVEVKENVTGARNTAATFGTDLSYTGSITWKSAKPSHLANILQGTVTTVAAGSVSAGSPSAKVGYHDKMLMMDHVKVSSVVVKDATDTTTYTVDVDYKLHADEGLIEPLSTGSIGDGDTLHLSYDYAAQKHLTINPSSGYKSFVFAGLNRARDNKRGRFVLYKLDIDPGAIPLIQGDQEAQIQTPFTLILDTARASGDQLYGAQMED